MTTVTSGTNGHIASSLLVPDLPLMATRAAMELDNILLERASSLEYVRLLADHLDRSTEGQGSVCHFTADLPTVDVIARALVAANCPVQTMADAATAAWKMAKELHSAGEPATEPAENQIKRLRTFCIELAKSAAIFRSMFEEPQPSSSQWS
jgi:hypothetical protein